MRKIKFRAWDKKRKDILYQAREYVGGTWTAEFTRWEGDTGWGHETDYLFGHSENFDPWDKDMRDNYNDKEWDRFVLMQYTGLEDKNGKEIYEGDVVMYDLEQDLDDEMNDTEGLIDEVVFVEGCFRPVSYDNIRCYYGARHINIEVLGNIYENPELLSEINS